MLNNPSLTNILLALCILINLITMFLVIVSMKRNGASKSLVKENQAAHVQVVGTSDSGHDRGQTGGYAESGVVFCRSCGTQYDSANSSCPSCKIAR